jgi:hypothetical protein
MPSRTRDFGFVEVSKTKKRQLDLGFVEIK